MADSNKDEIDKIISEAISGKKSADDASDNTDKITSEAEGAGDIAFDRSERERPERRPQPGDAEAPRRSSGDRPVRRKRPEGDERRASADGERPVRRKRPEGEGQRRSAEGDRPVRRKRPEGDERRRSADGERPVRKKRPEEDGAVTRKKKSPDGKGSSAGKKKKKKKWTKKQLIILISGAIFLGLCLIGFIIFLIFHYYYNLLGGEWKESTTSERMVVSIDDSTQSDTFDSRTAEEILKEQLESIKIDLMRDSEVFNILLVGQDLRSTADAGEQTNTDVMLLISLNSKNKTITMTSFMRDMWMYIPDCGYSERINAAFFAGGPTYLQNALEAYFGVKIDRYVVVNFNQFIDIVDTLGGLDLYVTPDEANGYEGADPYGDNTRGMQNPLDEQNRILGNPKGTDYIEMSYDIDGQVVHMNGNQALAYSRIRHVDYVSADGNDVGYSDFGRTKRQRIVISKIIEKAKGASLLQLNDLAHKIFGDIYTDIEEGEAASLLLNIFDYTNYKVQEMRIPEEGTYSGHWIQGRSVILCNTVKNAQDLQMLIYGETNIDEEKLKEFAEQNKYYDDNGNLVDYFNTGVTWRGW